MKNVAENQNQATRADTENTALAVLECRSPLVLTKRFRADGSSSPSDKAYLMRVHELPATTWAQLLDALTVLVDAPTLCIVRGALKPECPRADDTEVDPWMYRRLHDRPGEPANFVSVPRNWVVYDFDETAVPFDLADPEGAIRTWHAILPPELRMARAAFFPSASAHASACVRGKLVTWYDRPISESLARAYAVHYRADPSVAGAVQEVYFAAPIFEGCEDPLARRRTPIVFEGVDAKPPPRVALAATRARPAPIRVGHLPTGDRGIVASLGNHAELVGARFLLCGKLGGLMRKLGYEPEDCDAVIRAWLPAGDPRVDVERGARWALGAWDRPPETVSGVQGLAELVGREHANVIYDACLAARRPVKVRVSL